MKKPTIQRAWAVLCSIVILSACQKQTSTNELEKPKEEHSEMHATGAVPDDLAKVARVPAIVSSDFLSPKQSDLLGARGKSVRPGTGGDVTPPTVTITSPANGATVSGAVSIQVSASDNVGVTSVSLSISGTVIGTLNSAPYDFSWNTTTFPDGSYTLVANATDAAGNTNSYTSIVSKNVAITTLPPTTLPASYSLLMPPVQNQGGEGACAVFSCTYAARSAELFYKTNASAYSYATNVFSPEFVYNQTKIVDCGSGTGLITVLDFMINNGACTWESMPYSSSNGCSLMPTASQSSEAANYKISSYSKIVSSDVTTIKTMITKKHPVIITINPDQSFWDAKAGFIWKAYAGAPGISHNIVICGYDDAKHAYKVMNSWGTAWGDQGYSYIDYDFFSQNSFYYSYVING